MHNTHKYTVPQMMILINLADNCFGCLFILPAHKSVHHMHSWCPRSSEEGTGYPGIDGCKLPCRC